MGGRNHWVLFSSGIEIFFFRRSLIASQQLLMPALYTGLNVVVGYVALYIGLVLRSNL